LGEGFFDGDLLDDEDLLGEDLLGEDLRVILAMIRVY
jgi:hypothetical protein